MDIHGYPCIHRGLQTWVSMRVWGGYLPTGKGTRAYPPPCPIDTSSLVHALSLPTISMINIQDLSMEAIHLVFFGYPTRLDHVMRKFIETLIKKKGLRECCQIDRDRRI